MLKHALALGGLLAVTCSYAAEPAASTAWWQQINLGAMATYIEPSDVREAKGETVGAHLYVGAPLLPFSGWTTELSLAWNELDRLDGSGQDQLYQLGVDVLRHFEWTPSLTPYVVSGLAVAYEEIRAENFTRPSLGLGGGLQWRTPFAPLSVRVDARALAQENDYENAGEPTSGRAVLVDGRFGLGLNWDFGTVADACSPATPCMADADNDGVSDAADLCPDSLPGAVVDRTGCERVERRDTDGDGVSDALDQCPATPLGETVDAAGCTEHDAVVLEGVNFELDSDRLTASAKDILRPVAGLLTGGLRDIRIEISGHTDATGSNDYNDALSARRANAVKSYLAEQGVAASRMIATGYGASQPVADNATSAGRAQNRRVVFRVIR